jgi:hypothetical protein
VEFLFDGDPNMAMGDDQHLFIGFDGEAFDQRFFRDIADRTTVVSSYESQAKCFTISARLSGTYLTGQAAPIQPLQLDSGITYQFDLGLNDYDFGTNEDGQPILQRQHHMFYQDPGPDYWFGEQRNLPTMMLVGDPAD